MKLELPIQLDVEEQLGKLGLTISKDLQERTKNSTALVDTIRKHISERYPGSKHWSPSKVNADGNGSVDVDIPGASRAYHDIDIYPVSAPMLVFPTLEGREAFGLEKTSDSPVPLFRPEGHDVLMGLMGGSLVALFVLSEHVSQRQDRTLMPSDEALVEVLSKDVMK